MASHFVPKIAAIFVLDNDGQRLSAKYFTTHFANNVEKTSFEMRLFKKTRHNNARAESEIIMMDNFTVVFRSGSDAHFYVVGDGSENELILATVLDCFHDAISMLMRGQIDRRSLLDNLDLLMLTVDELVDGGTVMETDATAIVSRVLMRGVSGGAQVPLADMTISQAFASAKDSFIKSMGNREVGGF